MDSQNTLLGAVEVGRMLFRGQPLSNGALRKRILRMRENNKLPMVKLGKSYVISVRKLEEWFKENNL